MYRAVLELDPGNTAALSGLQAIADSLESTAREQVAAGQLEAAEESVRQGLTAVPDSTSLTALQQAILQRKDESLVR